MCENKIHVGHVQGRTAVECDADPQELLWEGRGCEPAGGGLLFRMYLIRFQMTLNFVSDQASLKPVLTAVQTLGTTGTGSQTHLILASFDTKLSVF